MSNLTLVPAYGRDYANKQAVQHEWESDKDFRIMDMSSSYHGKLINRSDARNFGVSRVNIRYSKQRKVHVINIEESSDE